MTGIILGAVGGGIGTLLLTPLAGRQTRDQLGERVGAFTAAARGEPVPDHLDGGTYARLGAVTRQAGGRATTLRDRVQERVQGVVSEAGPAVAALRDRVQELRVRTDSRDERARVGVGVGEAIVFTPAGSQPAASAAGRGTARTAGTTTPPGGAR